MGEVGLCARTGENEPPSDVLVCGVWACVWLRGCGLPPGGVTWRLGCRSGKQVSSKLTPVDTYTLTQTTLPLSDKAVRALAFLPWARRSARVLTA